MHIQQNYNCNRNVYTQHQNIHQHPPRHLKLHRHPTTYSTETSALTNHMTSHIILSPSTTTIFTIIFLQIIFLQIIIFLTHIMIPTLITQIRTDHLYYPHLIMMQHARRLHKTRMHIQPPCFKEQFLRTFLAGNTEKHKLAHHINKYTFHHLHIHK